MADLERQLQNMKGPFGFVTSYYKQEELMKQGLSSD
jgi:hypothetical protein